MGMPLRKQRQSVLPGFQKQPSSAVDMLRRPAAKQLGIDSAARGGHTNPLYPAIARRKRESLVELPVGAGPDFELVRRRVAFAALNADDDL